MTPEELETHTFNQLPESLVKKLIRAVFAAHSAAWDEARKAFQPPEFENMRGQYCRAKLEGYMREAAGMTEGVSASVERNPGDGPMYHTEIRGGLAILTASAVPTPGALVREAKFRLTLARDARLTLWEEEPDPDARLYVLLVHSRYLSPNSADWAKNAHLPGSAYLVWPSRDLDAYVHEVNLLDRYSEIAQEHLPQEWNQEAQVRYFERARKVKFA